MQTGLDPLERCVIFLPHLVSSVWFSLSLSSFRPCALDFFCFTLSIFPLQIRHLERSLLWRRSAQHTKPAPLLLCSRQSKDSITLTSSSQPRQQNIQNKKQNRKVLNNIVRSTPWGKFDVPTAGCSIFSAQLSGYNTTNTVSHALLTGKIQSLPVFLRYSRRRYYSDKSSLSGSKNSIDKRKKAQLCDFVGSVPHDTGSVPTDSCRHSHRTSPKCY